MAKYGKLAERKVTKAMRERKKGRLKVVAEKRLRAANRRLQLVFLSS